MKIKCERFVVDADVARCAGLSEVPSSKGARNVMQAMIKSDTVAIFCPTLADEWKKHRSKFSANWLSSMTAKKKILRVKPTETAAGEIQAAAISEDDKRIAEKDVHIVDAAVDQNAVIASNDNAARAVFQRILNGSATMEALVWVSPTASSEEIVSLIERAGFVPENWKL
ncbi:hypothetical protein [Pseudomonas lurida]